METKGKLLKGNGRTVSADEGATSSGMLSSVLSSEVGSFQQQLDAALVRAKKESQTLKVDTFFSRDTLIAGGAPLMCHAKPSNLFVFADDKLLRGPGSKLARARVVAHIMQDTIAIFRQSCPLNNRSWSAAKLGLQAVIVYWAALAALCKKPDYVERLQVHSLFASRKFWKGTSPAVVKSAVAASLQLDADKIHATSKTIGELGATATAPLRAMYYIITEEFALFGGDYYKRSARLRHIIDTLRVPFPVASPGERLLASLLGHLLMTFDAVPAAVIGDPHLAFSPENAEGVSPGAVSEHLQLYVRRVGVELFSLVTHVHKFADVMFIGDMAAVWGLSAHVPSMLSGLKALSQYANVLIDIEEFQAHWEASEHRGKLIKEVFTDIETAAVADRLQAGWARADWFVHSRTSLSDPQKSLTIRRVFNEHDRRTATITTATVEYVDATPHTAILQLQGGRTGALTDDDNEWARAERFDDISPSLSITPDTNANLRWTWALSGAPYTSMWQHMLHLAKMGGPGKLLYCPENTLTVWLLALSLCHYVHIEGLTKDTKEFTAADLKLDFTGVRIRLEFTAEAKIQDFASYGTATDNFMNVTMTFTSLANDKFKYASKILYLTPSRVATVKVAQPDNPLRGLSMDGNDYVYGRGLRDYTMPVTESRVVTFSMPVTMFDPATRVEHLTNSKMFSFTMNPGSLLDANIALGMYVLRDHATIANLVRARHQAVVASLLILPYTMTAAKTGPIEKVNLDDIDTALAKRNDVPPPPNVGDLGGEAPPPSQNPTAELWPQVAAQIAYIAANAAGTVPPVTSDAVTPWGLYYVDYDDTRRASGHDVENFRRGVSAQKAKPVFFAARRQPRVIEHDLHPAIAAHVAEMAAAERNWISSPGALEMLRFILKKSNATYAPNKTETHKKYALLLLVLHKLALQMVLAQRAGNIVDGMLADNALHLDPEKVSDPLSLWMELQAFFDNLYPSIATARQETPGATEAGDPTE